MRDPRPPRPSLPGDLPVVERSAVRVVVLDAVEAIPLFHTHDYEREDYLGFRWWRPPEITSSSERFYPGRLPALLDAFLHGEQIDEPFELWS